MAIVADEVFLDYSLTKDRPLTFSSNNAGLTFTLSGLSKISALPQMKVAWIAATGARPLLADAMNRLEIIADTYLSMNAPLQRAVPVMLEERHGIQRQLLQRITANLASVDAQLNLQKLCRRLEVEGGWYVVVRIPAAGADEDFAIALLRETDVLAQPGHFYDFSGDGHLVISLITSHDEFTEGIRRLLKFVTDLHS
jgi:aspartate/methionine/tyrosine aminotransferase